MAMLIISQYKSSMLNRSPSTNPAKEIAARVKGEPLTRHLSQMSVIPFD
jgi:hypothetical protein